MIRLLQLLRAGLVVYAQHATAVAIPPKSAVAGAWSAAHDHDPGIDARHSNLSTRGAMQLIRTGAPDRSWPPNECNDGLAIGPVSSASKAPADVDIYASLEIMYGFVAPGRGMISQLLEADIDCMNDIIRSLMTAHSDTQQAHEEPGPNSLAQPASSKKRPATDQGERAVRRPAPGSHSHSSVSPSGSNASRKRRASRLPSLLERANSGLEWEDASQDPTGQKWQSSDIRKSGFIPAERLWTATTYDPSGVDGKNLIRPVEHALQGLWVGLNERSGMTAAIYGDLKRN